MIKNQNAYSWAYKQWDQEEFQEQGPEETGWSGHYCMLVLCLKPLFEKETNKFKKCCALSWQPIRFPVKRRHKYRQNLGMTRENSSQRTKRNLLCSTYVQKTFIHGWKCSRHLNWKGRFSSVSGTDFAQWQLQELQVPDWPLHGETLWASSLCLCGVDIAAAVNVHCCPHRPQPHRGMLPANFVWITGYLW